MYTYFANDLRRLCIVYSSQILLHGCIVISFLIEKIAVFAEYNILLQCINARLLCKVDCQDIKISLVKNLKFLL